MYKCQLPQDDLSLIYEHSQKSLSSLANKNIFITGATGFFGKWLCQTLTSANQHFNLNLTLHLLSRDWDVFQKNHQNFFDLNCTELHTGDIANFPFPPACEVVIHAANDARPQHTPEGIALFEESLEKGNQRLLSYIQETQPEKLLITSSGAVYGSNTQGSQHWSEDQQAEKLDNFYGKGKLLQEQFFSQAEFSGTDILIARCFAFIGPFLPLDSSYAAGNFILNAIQGQPICIQGDGQPLRSYLYSADLIIWLLNILSHGTSKHPYNVGSDAPLSISELAHKISSLSEAKPEVQVAQQVTDNKPPPAYLPSIKRAQDELGLQVYTPLEKAIEKTLKWHQDWVV